MTPVKTDPRDVVLGRIKELPPLPMVLHELMAVMRDANCSADDITRVLSTDQALASKILRLVNSSFYGMSGNVTTISQAVIILGHAALRSLATGLSVADGIGRTLPPNRRQAFWQHALATAAAAEVLARHTGADEPEEAFVAGLLHDIGHLILMMALPAEHAAAFKDDVLGDLEQERRYIGLDHCRSGRYLLQHWKLPPPLLECVRLHHAEACVNEGNPLLTIVALADRLARLNGATGEAPEATGDVVPLMAALNLAPETVLGILPDIARRLAESRAFLQAAELEPVVESDSGDRAPRRLVVLANDRARTQWLEGLAGQHGHRLVATRDFLLDPERQAVDVVICDTDSISDTQAERLAPALAATTAVILVPCGCDPGKIPAVRRDGCRKLPMVFSVADLEF